MKRLSILLSYATKEQRRLMRDKRNGKKKAKRREESVFLSFRALLSQKLLLRNHYHVTTRPLLRDYLSKRVRRLKRERRIEDNYSILRSIIRTRRSIIRFRQSVIRIGRSVIRFGHSIVRLGQAIIRCSVLIRSTKYRNNYFSRTFIS